MNKSFVFFVTMTTCALLAGCERGASFMEQEYVERHVLDTVVLGRCGKLEPKSVNEFVLWIRGSCVKEIGPNRALRLESPLVMKCDGKPCSPGEIESAISAGISITKSILDLQRRGGTLRVVNSEAAP